MTTTTTRPTDRPSESKATKEYMKILKIQKTLFPKLNEDNFESYNYKEIVDPLRKATDLPKREKDFLKQANKCENLMERVAKESYDYEAAKTDADSDPEGKRLFEGFEEITKNDPSRRPNLKLSDSQKKDLFSADSESDFGAKIMAMPTAYKMNGPFVTVATKLFKYIHKKRTENQQKRIQAYLHEVFKSEEHMTEEGMKKCKIIGYDYIKDNSKVKQGIIKTHEAYLIYRKRIHNHLKLEKKLKKQKRTVETRTVEYMKSGEHFIASNIQKIRENWGAMNGKEQFIATLTLLVATSKIMNSQDESVSKLRDTLKSVVFYGLAWVGLDKTAKLLTGKGMSKRLSGWADKKSDKLKYIKEGFHCKDMEDADKVNKAMVFLWNEDFVDLADDYVKVSKARTTEADKSVDFTTCSTDDLSGKDAYQALKVIDASLQRDGSSIEQLRDAVKASQGSRATMRVTFGQIITTILKKRNVEFKIEGGKITVVVGKEKLTWNAADKEKAKAFWTFTGDPDDWDDYSILLVDYGKPGIWQRTHVKEHLQHKYNKSQPLSGLITEGNFGRYRIGFDKLYSEKYKGNETDKFHKYEKGNTMYMTSRVSIDYSSFRDSNLSKINAMQKAHTSAMAELKKDSRFASVKNRMNEFAQPVCGAFLAPPQKLSTKPDAKLGRSTEYVMFIAVSLPSGNDYGEYELRKRKEWPDGDKIRMKDKKPLKLSDPLTLDDILDIERKWEKPGTLEMFLSNFRFPRYVEDKSGNLIDNKTIINKVLKHFTKKYKDSGMSKAGLIRWLCDGELSDKDVNEAWKECKIKKYFADLAASTAGLKEPNEFKEPYEHTYSNKFRDIITEEVQKVHKNDKLSEYVRSLGVLASLCLAGDKKAHTRLRIIDSDAGVTGDLDKVFWTNRESSNDSDFKLIIVQIVKWMLKKKENEQKVFDALKDYRTS